MANILIVDDSSFDRFVIGKCVEKNRHKVVGEASNCAEALKEYQEKRPDIVILDIVMNHENGLNVLKEIKNMDSDANVIMCTSAALQNIVIQASQLGAKYFLAKPVNEEVLARTIDKVLQAKK